MANQAIKLYKGSSDTDKRVGINLKEGIIPNGTLTLGAPSNRYNHIFWQNSAGSLVADIEYDTGNSTNVTSGKYYFTEYSPKSTADTTTTGHWETFALPTVDTGRSTDKVYSIVTTKPITPDTSTFGESTSKAYIQFNKASTYSPLISAYAQTGSWSIATYPNSDEFLYFTYNNGGGTENAYTKRFSLDPSVGSLTNRYNILTSAGWTTSGASQINNILTLYREGTTANDYPAGIKFSVKDTTLNLTENYGYIYMYNDHNTSSNAYGGNLVIQSTGGLFIGSGEAPGAHYAAVTKPYTGEVTYITSDTSIYLQGSASTIANRVGMVITAGNLLPAKVDTTQDGIGAIGTTSNRWSQVVAKDIYAYGGGLHAINTTTNSSAVHFKFSDINSSTYAQIYSQRNVNYGGRLTFRQYSENSSGNLLSGYENYQLPQTTQGRTSGVTYSILTTKGGWTAAGTNSFSGRIQIYTGTQYPVLAFKPSHSTNNGENTYGPATIFVNAGSTTEITYNRMYFRVYSPTASSGKTTYNGYYDQFVLPAADIGRTSDTGNGSYDILTTKNAVTFAQGGTGATSRLGAFKAITNQAVGTEATYFVTFTTNWNKGGYTGVTSAKTVLGIDSLYGSAHMGWKKASMSFSSNSATTTATGVTTTSVIQAIRTGDGSTGTFYAVGAASCSTNGTIRVNAANGGTLSGATNVFLWWSKTAEGG